MTRLLVTLLLVPAGPTPSPTPLTDDAAVRNTPVVLWMVMALMAAAILLGLSMRSHLRKIPRDLNVPTRKAESSSTAEPPANGD
ncbi:MAG: hypothetical protein RL745_837 [Actinomycetota bacterium]|jgi:hypothetical protein